MKTDSAIKHDVEAELSWEPEVDDTDISVKINNAVVTLTGFVKTYAQKYRAERHRGAPLPRGRRS
jgi:osmotically-inducible protein OsmY